MNGNPTRPARALWRWRRKSPPPDDGAVTPVRRRPSLDFSLTGLVYSGMMLFMGLAAVESQAALLFGVFGLMAGVLLISSTVGRAVLRRLEVRRELPEHLVVGQPATATYHLSNRKRFWPSLSVSLCELDGCEAFTRQPFAYMLHAAPGMTAVVPTEVTPKRRGVYVLGACQLSTSFPFGFIKRAVVRRQRDVVLVHPPLATVDRRLLQRALSAEKTGATLRPKPGGEDEFYGVKEYRPGESPRLIHWRRSARTGVLVARQMTQVAPPRLLLLVDTHLPHRSGKGHAAVERAIAMAASLAAFALESDLRVGLMAWSGHWLALSPDRSKRHGRDLLAAISRLPLNQNQDAPALLAAARTMMQSDTTAILLTGSPNPVQQGLADHVRGSLLVIDANGPQAHRWFRFHRDIDFAHCMPADQEPRA